MPPRQHHDQSHPHNRHLVIAYRHLVGLVLAAFMVGIALTTELKRTDVSEDREPSPSDSLHSSGLPDFSGDDDDAGPGVAWLMSFPNSGTSFTLKMIHHVSQMVAATNYGEESTDVTGNSVPVHTNETNGPFWIYPGSARESVNITYPSSYVLTKTHCGGRCENCGPSKYVESPHSFLVQCLSGKRVVTNSKGKRSTHDVRYAAELVKKAVHLIRSPYDNVVSRFHLQVHGFIRKKDKAMIDSFPNTREGFRAFCRSLDARYSHEEESSRLVDQEVLDIVKHVPCHAEFFRYVEWHNLAFFTTEELLAVPTHVLHYEDYSTRFNETVSELLKFLHLEWRGDESEFVAGKEYSEYYLPEEREAVKAAAKVMSSRVTWENIEHYFP